MVKRNLKNYVIYYCLLMAVFFLLTGCGQPSMEELLNADYGEYPQNHRHIVYNYLQKEATGINEPVYRIYEPYQGYTTVPKDQQAEWVTGYGWTVIGRIYDNSDSDSPVLGKEYHFVFRGDKYFVIPLKE